MMNENILSTPLKAREHARAQAGTRVRAMPTLPASAATDLPPGVGPGNILWDETLAAGDYASRILQRGSRLRLTNLDGDCCANFLAYNADRPIERLNVADTVKVQWNAYLAKGNLLLSDMGRVLLSIVEDTSANHDTLCGASNEKSNARKYGTGTTYSPCPNARDRLLLALAKYGLAKEDICANVNFFKGVRVNGDGGLLFDEQIGKAGAYIELRAEMNVLVVVANTPHVLDPRREYRCTNLRMTAWRGQITPTADPIRNSSPEALRAFENVEDYFLN
jgi:urea carboxylase-associated protein 2